MSTAPSYRLTKKIQDEKFDIEHVHQYSLLIHLGSNDCQIGVVDSEDSRLIFFEDYIFNTSCSQAEQWDVLKKIHASHSFIGAGFWKAVTLSVKNNKFVQIPVTLFDEDAAEKYLQFNAQIEGCQVLFCHHKKCEMVTVFALHNKLTEWMRGLYKKSIVHFTHQSASLIEGVCEKSHAYKNEPLYLYVDRFKLHIMLMQDNVLVYYNQFYIKHFKDYIKYIMMVFKAMRMSQESSPVVLWGYIGKKSSHFAELSKYIRHIDFGYRPDYLKFGYVFDEIEEHSFFDLYPMYLFS